MYERILKKVETAVKTVKDSQENSEDAQAQAREVPVAQSSLLLTLFRSRNILKSINVAPTMCTLMLRPFVTVRKRSLGQGNVLPPVCQSFCSQWLPKRTLRILQECILV